MARSMLGPVTTQIWEPDSASSFRHSQAMNRSINYDTSKPVGLLNPDEFITILDNNFLLPESQR